MVIHIPIACYVSKIPNYCCCYGNSERVLFVSLLIAIVSLLYKLTVNCCQLCKHSVFDCVILLSYHWREVHKKAHEGRFVLSVCRNLWAEVCRCLVLGVHVMAGGGGGLCNVLLYISCMEPTTFETVVVLQEDIKECFCGGGGSSRVL